MNEVIKTLNGSTSPEAMLGLITRPPMRVTTEAKKHK